MDCAAVDDGQGCTKPGRWRPVLLLRVNREHPPAEAELGLSLCDEHREKRNRVEDFLTDAGWKLLAMGIGRAGKAEPDRALTELGWHEVS